MTLSNLKFLKASLGETKFKCGKSNCSCIKGKLHTAFYLSYRKSGKTHTVHIPKAIVPEIEGLCLNWKEKNKLLEIETDKTINKILNAYRKKKAKKK